MIQYVELRTRGYGYVYHEIKRAINVLLKDKKLVLLLNSEYQDVLINVICDLNYKDKKVFNSVHYKNMPKGLIGYIITEEYYKKLIGEI